MRSCPVLEHKKRRVFRLFFFVKSDNTELNRRYKNALIPNGMSALNHAMRVVGTPGLEPGTSCMSSKHSNQLSYASVSAEYIKILRAVMIII